MNKKDKILTPRMLSDMTGFSHRWVEVLRLKKMPPVYFKIGRQYFYRLKDVIKWMEYNYEKGKCNDNRLTLEEIYGKGIYEKNKMA